MIIMLLASVLLAQNHQTTQASKPKKGDSCTRHLTNASNGSWYFSASGLSGNNVLFIPLNAAAKKTGHRSRPRGASQSIQPYGQYEIIYTSNFLGRISGSWTITDQNQTSKSFQYNNYINDCPSIDHEGSTGSVSVNDPANGDLLIGGQTW